MVKKKNTKRKGNYGNGNKTIQVEVAQVIEIDNMPAVSIKDVLAIKPGAIALAEQVNTLAVTDQASADVMNLSLMKLNKVKKFIEELRKQATKPLRDATSTVNAQVKEKAAPFVEAFETGKAKLDTWRREQQAIIDAENRRIAEENRIAEEKRQAEINRRLKLSKAQGGDGSNNTPVAEIEPVKTKQPLSVTDSTKTFRKLNIAVVEVGKVPAEWLKSDKVRDAIASNVRLELQGWLNQRGGLAKVKQEELPDIPGVTLRIETGSRF